MMHAMYLRPLNALGKQNPTGPITIDSRKAKPGMIFIAAAGATPNSREGHEFISQAISNGCAGLIVEKVDFEIPTHIPVWQAANTRVAAAQLAEQFAGYPSKKLNLCGVTGTNGKTTVTFLVASMAKSFGCKAGVLGTLGAGTPGKLKPFGFTTPEAENLSPLLADFVREGYEQITMEVSSHALATHRVDGLTFKAAGLTNLSQDHLDFHGDMQSYLAAKMRLFEELLPEDGVMVLPETSPLTPLQQLERGIFWGYTPKANIQASEIQHTPDGMRFKLRIKDQLIPVQSSLVGSFNLDNILCAAGLAHATGISIEAIAQGLTEPVIPKGRLQRITLQKPAVFIDFAHTPDAMTQVLKTLREICQGRLIIVFGCGGERDRSKRPLMAQAALLHADLVFVTQDNPRNENPAQIIQDMRLPQTTTVIEDRRLAIQTAIESAGLEDMVLIAGKGHETTQQIGNELKPFDDTQIAYEILLHRYENTSTR